jgi:hypothetical protein
VPGSFNAVVGRVVEGRPFVPKRLDLEDS